MWKKSWLLIFERLWRNVILRYVKNFFGNRDQGGLCTYVSNYNTIRLHIRDPLLYLKSAYQRFYLNISKVLQPIFATPHSVSDRIKSINQSRIVNLKKWDSVLFAACLFQRAYCILYWDFVCLVIIRFCRLRYICCGAQEP